MSLSSREIDDLHWLMELVHSLDSGIMVIDVDYRLRIWNNFMELNSGIPAHQVIEQPLFDVVPNLNQAWIRRKIEAVFEIGHTAFSSWEARPNLLPFALSRPITGIGESMFQSATILPLRNLRGEIGHVCILLYDVTELAVHQLQLREQIIEREQMHTELQKQYSRQESLLQELKETQQQLLQSEKMASIGQLSSGVAHEINNPISFVYTNMVSMQEYMQDLKRMLAQYQQAEQDLPENSDHYKQITALKEEIDLDYLLEDVDNLVAESLEGTERVKRIVLSLKDFSRVGSESWEGAELLVGLNSTVDICWNEMKEKIHLVKAYQDLPMVECIPSQINQVFLILLKNARSALEEEDEGEIRLQTHAFDDRVSISVTDSGVGIPPENYSKVFEPFFTTRQVGEGTGLGLSIAYGIIRRHNGEIELKSEVGVGTTMTVTLPLKQP
jgi:two-component system, NtrC family, sensor kinase